jgi:hypothetical protein
MSNHIDCPRSSSPPMRYPRAELIGVILAALWCVGFWIWLVHGLAMR